MVSEVEDNRTAICRPRYPVPVAVTAVAHGQQRAHHLMQLRVVALGHLLVQLRVELGDLLDGTLHQQREVTNSVRRATA